MDRFNKLRKSIILLIVMFCINLISYGETDTMKNKEDHLSLLKQLKQEEGFASKLYADTVGALTIGFGHNIGGRPLSIAEQKRLFPGSNYPLSIPSIVLILRSKGISKEDATYLLEQDILIAEKDCKDLFSKWNDIPSDKKLPLIDMAFNLGKPKLSKFVKMRKAVEKGDWKEAAKQVRNSLSYLQLPKRYERLAKELES